MGFKNELEMAQQGNRYRDRLLGLCFVLMLILAYGWYTAPQKLTIDIPPDLTAGATVKPGTFHKATIYTLADTVLKQLNLWSADGEKDFLEQAGRLQHLITPNCLRQLRTHYDDNRTEYRRRTRHMIGAPGSGYTEQHVHQKTLNSWIAYIDGRVIEHLNGNVIKNTLIRYPVRIVRWDVNQDFNPWGLAFDCYAGDGPVRLYKDAEENS